MIKYTIIVKCEDREDLKAITNAEKNQLKLDCLYDEVFRPVIKYGENKEEVEAFEKVWEKLNDYLQE